MRETPIKPSQLLGIEDIAHNLGVAVATVNKWRQHHILPAPVTTISGVPIFAWQDILNWALATNRVRLVPILDKGGRPKGSVARLRGEKVT